MTETVRLEVPATFWALATLRMVVGGVGAHFSLGLDELDDLTMAVEAIFRAAVELEDSRRYALEVDVSAEKLGIIVGPFRSVQLRQRLFTAPGSEQCLDLCRLLTGTVESFSVIDRDGAFSISLLARRNPPSG